MMLNYLLKILPLVLILVSSCTTEYILVPLPLPPKPSIPLVTDKELSCLIDDVYKRVAHRDLLCKQYSERLEAIIRTTHD